MNIQNVIEEQLTTDEGRFTLATLLRSDFTLFIKIFFKQITNQDFTFKDFHLRIIKTLESIVFDTSKKKNLIINMPPRHGKSIICQYFIAWGYILNPQSNYIYTSYSDNLVLKFSSEIKKIIYSDLYQKIFNLSIAKDNNAKRGWATEQGGTFYASSQGGTITGFGSGVKQPGWGGCTIIDDPLKPNDAKYDVKRENALDFYTSTLKNRINKEDTPIILIMQRLHTDDLVGYLLENEINDFDIIKIPAFNENTQKTIWSEIYSAEQALKDKEINDFYFYSQYQQEPIIKGGNIIKSHWFCYYDTIPTQFEKIYQSWDVAETTNDTSDYSVCTTWGTLKTPYSTQYYLIDLWQGKYEYPQLKQRMLNLNNIYNPNVILIEQKSNGTPLFQDLKHAGLNKLVNIKPTDNKTTRLEAVVDCFYQGNVLFNENADYLANLEGELISFPTSKHDDIVDSVSQFLNYMTTNKPVKMFVGSF